MGGDLMDIEKLIERLYKHHTDWGEGRTQDFFEVCLDCKDAATALSMLQGENKQLRGELEYEQEHANAYHEECGQWEAENEKLRAKLEQVKAERDAAVSDIETALAYGMKDCELCVNVQCYVRGGTKPCLPKWRGPKKED